MRHTTVKYDLMLLIVAVFWGTGFIATKFVQDNGMTSAMIVALRMLFAALFILLV